MIYGEGRELGEDVCAVQDSERVFAVYRQVNHSDGFGQEVFEMASASRERDGVAVSDLLMAELNYIAFDSAFLKFRNYVENVHNYL